MFGTPAVLYFGKSSCLRMIKRSVGQSLSAFCTASLENGSAVGRFHSFSETMLFLSLTLFGLVCSEHFLHLLECLSEAFDT